MTLVSRALNTVTQSWLFNCEKGGIRRVLMNLLGNSLKFTSVAFIIIISLALKLILSQDGYIHVGLKRVPVSNNVDEKMFRIELSVLDTGKVSCTE